MNLLHILMFTNVLHILGFFVSVLDMVLGLLMHVLFILQVTHFPVTMVVPILLGVTAPRRASIVWDIILLRH